MNRKVDGRGDPDPMKLTAAKLAPPERSDSTSSVDSRSSGTSKRGEGGVSAKHSRKPQQVFSKLTVERSDSTSSVDSHSSVSRRDAGERVVGKHGRKPQQVYSSSGRKLTGGEEDEEGEEEDEEEEEVKSKPKRANSLSVSGALPSNMSISGGSTPTTAPAGGFNFASKTAAESKGKGKAATPTLVSLPLLYSARADPMDGAMPHSAAQQASGGACRCTPVPAVLPSMSNLERLGYMLQKVTKNPQPVEAVRRVIAQGNVRKPLILSNEGLPFSESKGK